jgi:hypothetical protein
MTPARLPDSFLLNPAAQYLRLLAEDGGQGPKTGNRKPRTDKAAGAGPQQVLLSENA